MDARSSPSGSFPKLADHIWRAPLVPIALALTAGILIDRYWPLPPAVGVAAASMSVWAWIVSTRRQHRKSYVVCLWAACAGIGAAYHHVARHPLDDNDIRHFAAADAVPGRLRGVVDSEPNYVAGSGPQPLRSFATAAQTRFVLRVQRLKTSIDWRDVRGLAQVTLEAKIHPVHVGDTVEIVGRLQLPRPPANPGEFDYPEFLRDQGIGVVVNVPPSTEGITLLAEGWPRTFSGWLAVVRGWGQEVFARHLPDKVAGVAGALLLGEGSTMTRDDWDKYARTGVIHVLAISGQHLVVLACFLWAVLRIFCVSRRCGMLAIAAFLIAYAFLTGGRPPVMRAAWAMAAYCGAICLQRRNLPANTFALAWIGVIIANPTDIFNLGCQLSFLAVAVLFWGTDRAVAAARQVKIPFLWRPGLDPELQALIDESRPLLLAYLIKCKRRVVECYLVSAVVWLAVTPLVAGSQHLVSPVALLIGPPLVLLTSAALISGFLMLLAAPVGLAAVFAWPVHWSLAGCEFLVDAGAALPGSYFFVPDVPTWWLWVFYLALFAFLTVGWLRLRPLLFAACSAAWVALGTLVLLGVFRSADFRCTFLAVGHGGCTVLETADGRVLVYDAGAIGGPDVTRRKIAPYLWQRGIRRIDDLLISHADLDHFNGVTALLERFSVGRVTLTPSFADRLTPPVQVTIEELRRRGIPTRIIKAGDDLGEADVPAEVLHPPAVGPDGNENARSLVLLLRHKNLSILLTGDLEGPGLERVLALAPPRVDILMAPHHGSKTSNIKRLADWAKPKVAISSQGPPRGDPRTANPYEPAGAAYLTTWKDGAVTIRAVGGKWNVQTYLSKRNIEARMPVERR